jgi:hypothetical protein
MAENNVGSVVVCDEGQMVGFSPSGITAENHIDGALLTEYTFHEIMTKEYDHSAPRQTLEE